MKRPLRIFLILAGTLLLLCVFGLIAANLYANSSHFKARLKVAVEGNLGMTPEFSRLSISPWSGLVLHGLETRVEKTEAEETPQRPPSKALAGARKISIRPRLSTLLNREIEIREVKVEGSVLDCLRTADGQFLLPLPSKKMEVQQRPKVTPRPPPPNTPPPQPPIKRDTPSPPQNGKKPETSPTPPATPTPRPSPTPKPAPQVPPAPPQAAPAPSAPSVEPEPEPNLPHGVYLHRLKRRIGLARVRLTDGGVRLLAEGIEQPLLEISRYALDIDLAESSSGTLDVENFSLLGIPMAHGFRADVALTPEGELRITQIDSSILQGRAQGEASLLINRLGIPFKGEIVGRNLSLGSLGEQLKEEGFPLTPDRGEAEFRIRSKGVAQIPERVFLSIEARASNVEAADLRALLPAIQAVAGGRSHMLEDALVGDLSLKLRIADGMMRIDDFRAGSRHLVIRGSGVIGKQGALQINARLYATKEGQGFFREFEKNLPEEERTDFSPLEHTSWGYRDLHIRGNLRQPMGDFLSVGQFTTLQSAITEIRQRVAK